MKAELVGVPEVEAGSSVPSQEISGPWAGVGVGIVVGWAGGRGEERVVLEGSPFEIFFGCGGGPYLIRFLLLEVEVEPHFCLLCRAL